MFDGNTALLKQKYDQLNVPYRAQITHYINEAAALPTVLATVIASYLHDEEQFASMRRNLIRRLQGGGRSVRVVSIAGDVEHLNSNIIAVCVRAHDDSVDMLYIHYVTAYCEDIIIESLAGFGNVYVFRHNAYGAKYAINQKCEKTPRFHIVARLLKNCGGHFDEWGNLWL